MKWVAVGSELVNLQTVRRISFNEKDLKVNFIFSGRSNLMVNFDSKDGFEKTVSQFQQILVNSPVPRVDT